MQPSINPYVPKEYVNGDHLIAITREALTDWMQRVKKPYVVEGERGPIALTADDYHRIQGILITLLNDNKDKVEHWMKIGRVDDE